MGRVALERILVAAKDDAILASWAKVLDDYKVGAHYDVPPHEHWEAYQEFFTCGLVTSVMFDNTDVKRVFFSGERPHQGDVQDVLENIKLLCPEHCPEEPMNKAKPPMAAFSTDSSIATRREPSGIAKAPSRNELRSRRSPTGLSAFQPQQHAVAPAQQPRGLDAFQPQSAQPTNALACTEVDAGIYVGGYELNGHIVCCGEPLQIVEEGGDVISPEDLPQGEDYALLEYMFHSECGNCNTVYHTTAGKPIPRDDY